MKGQTTGPEFISSLLVTLVCEMGVSMNYLLSNFSKEGFLTVWHKHEI